MIFVLFEVTIKEEYMDSYLALTAGLKEELAKAKGFIRSERFSSLVNDRKLLSLSVWENEEAINEWRNQVSHRICQQQGDNSIFEGYTISVASKIRSYSNKERSEAPVDSNHYFKNN